MIHSGCIFSQCWGLPNQIWQKVKGGKRFRTPNLGPLSRGRCSRFFHVFWLPNLWTPFHLWGIPILQTIVTVRATSYPRSWGMPDTCFPRSPRSYNMACNLGSVRHEHLPRILKATASKNSFGLVAHRWSCPLSEPPSLVFSAILWIHFEFMPSLLLSTRINFCFSWPRTLSDVSSCWEACKMNGPCLPKSRGETFSSLPVLFPPAL